MLKKQILKDGMEYVLDPDVGHVDAICKDVADFLSSRDLKKHIFETGLIIREAVCNGILHGCKKDPELRVQLRFELKNGKLHMVIIDEGSGWNWKSNSGKLPENVKDSGRGLYIMRHYADEVKYNDKGNRLTIVKRVD